MSELAKPESTAKPDAASQPYLKALVPACEPARVNSRLETTTWTTSALGPPVGGLLVSATSPVASIDIDAVSYLLAACWWRRIRQPEPPPPTSGGRRQWLADTAAGWQYIVAHRTLRHLFFNAALRRVHHGVDPADRRLPAPRPALHRPFLGRKRVRVISCLVWPLRAVGSVSCCGWWRPLASGCWRLTG